MFLENFHSVFNSWFYFVSQNKQQLFESISVNNKQETELPQFVGCIYKQDFMVSFIHFHTLVLIKNCVEVLLTIYNNLHCRVFFFKYGETMPLISFLEMSWLVCWCKFERSFKVTFFLLVVSMFCWRSFF